MIYYTDEARKNAIENIQRLIPIVASVPGDKLSFGDSQNINYYLKVLRDAIEAEQYNINRERRKRERRGE